MVSPPALGFAREGNDRPGQLWCMPGGVHGRRADSHLPRLSKEDTFVSRLQGVIVPTDRDMTWKDLWEADMGVVMTEYFFKDDVDGTKYGHLPKMAEQHPLVRR